MAMPDISRIAELLGGRPVLGRTVKTAAQLDEVVRAGIPFRGFERLVARVTRTDADRAMVEDLVAPRTTRLRREQAGVLSPEESERAARVARLQALAESVLESVDEAYDFLYAPHPLLDDAVPMTLARTDIGAHRVEDILWKLEYGLPV